MADRNARDDMFDNLVGGYFDDTYDVDADTNLPGERPRFVLVEENTRGSDPRYVVSFHDDLEDAGSAHVDQEFAEDWRIVEGIDLDTGATYEGDIQSTVTWVEKPAALAPPPAPLDEALKAYDTARDEAKRALIAETARRVREEYPEATGLVGSALGEYSFEVTGVCLTGDRRSPTSDLDPDGTGFFEDLESDLLNQLAGIEAQITDTPLTRITFPPL